MRKRGRPTKESKELEESLEHPSSTTTSQNVTADPAAVISDASGDELPVLVRRKKKPIQVPSDSGSDTDPENAGSQVEVAPPGNTLSTARIAPSTPSGNPQRRSFGDGPTTPSGRRGIKTNEEVACWLEGEYLRRNALREKR